MRGNCVLIGTVEVMACLELQNIHFISIENVQDDAVAIQNYEIMKGLKTGLRNQ